MDGFTQPCCVCGEPARTDYQRHFRPDRDGYWLVTCENAVCPLCGYTFGAPDYPPQNLADYLPKVEALP